jgi:hypothetical protein
MYETWREQKPKPATAHYSEVVTSTSSYHYLFSSSLLFLDHRIDCFLTGFATGLYQRLPPTFQLHIQSACYYYHMICQLHTTQSSSLCFNIKVYTPFLSALSRSSTL